MRRRGSGNRAWAVLLAAAILVAATTLVAAAAASLFDLAETGTAAQVQAAVKGANVNAVDDAGRTVLMHAAAYNSDPQVVALLVSAGAKVNARGPRQWTALMMAAWGNPNPAVVDSLLAAGANAKLRSDAGETAYDYGADNDKLKGTPTYARLRAAAGGKTAGAGER